MDFGSYIIGLFDGEGCLIIRFCRETRNGWNGYSIGFRIEITNTNHQIIQRVRNYFGLGRIDIDKRINAHIWRVEALKDIKKIITFLEDKVIIKQKDLKLFKEAYIKYINRDGRRVTKELVAEIYSIRYSMNGGPKSIRKPFVAI